MTGADLIPIFDLPLRLYTDAVVQRRQAFARNLCIGRTRVVGDGMKVEEATAMYNLVLGRSGGRVLCADMNAVRGGGHSGTTATKFARQARRK